MERILELFKEKRKLERALLVLAILPLPGIGLGLILQIKKIDKMIEEEIKRPENKAVLVVLPKEDDKDKEK